MLCLTQRDSHNEMTSSARWTLRCPYLLQNCDVFIIAKIYNLLLVCKLCMIVIDSTCMLKTSEVPDVLRGAHLLSVLF
jgi:hypothetical protein